MRRALAATVLVGAMVAVAPGPPATAQATSRWHDGACAADDTVGVTIVVDFQELGGGVNVRCTERPPTDGADALDAAGISWQGVVRWGRGFVCKIAGKPADDPCIDTPPASAYWSYWLAPRGGRWCYSNLGVSSRTPPPGTVEGWSFSLDRDGGQSPPPRMAPPARAPGLRPNPLGPDDCDPSGGSVPTTTTTPTTTRPSRPPDAGTGAPRPDDPVPPGEEQAPSGTAPPIDGHEASTTTRPGETTTTSTSTTTTRPGEREAGGTAPGRDGTHGEEGALDGANAVDLSRDGTEAGDGLPVSTAAGAGLVVVLAGVGAVIARRRRVGAHGGDG